MSSRFRERLRTSVAEPGQAFGRWAPFVGFQIALWRFCARRLREHDVMGMSAALCYRTIFTLIPILVLALLVAKSLGALEDSKRSLREFLEASGFAQIAAVQDADPSTAGPPDAVTVPSSTDTATAHPRKVINVADEIENIVSGVEG